MRTPLFHLTDVLLAVQKKKVLTKQELLDATGCSVMTAWRLLSKHGYYTSYNCNARYYTLAGIPQFDEHGLWSHREIRFSKWGALTHTIVSLVEQSQQGMTADQLQQLLHLDTLRPALSRLAQQKRVAREKIGSQFVYFPLEEKARIQQQVQRTQQPPSPTVRLPPPEQIIGLLVEIIQRPKNSPRQWARRLARQGIRLSCQDIQDVLDHYQIDVKKGLFTF